MTNMTLSKALKHKNRVTSRIQKISRDITDQNCTLAGNDLEVDVKALEIMRHELMMHLVDLKTAIHKVNVPVHKYIFLQGELKQAIVFYRGIDTSHGKSKTRNYISDDTSQYQSIIRKLDIDRSVVDLERRIDDIQDKLDEFNATNSLSIEIPKCVDRPFASISS